MTTSGQWIGSVDYMAPEQLRAEPVDARTDVYALGGVLHAALTGDAPFRRQTVPQTIAAHLGDKPPRPSAMAGVDPIFDAVVARALAKDPADRYSSAGDLGRAALAAARGERLTIPERIVARGPAAPSEDPTGRLPQPEPRAATRIAPTRADELGGPPLAPVGNGRAAPRRGAPAAALARRSRGRPGRATAARPRARIARASVARAARSASRPRRARPTRPRAASRAPAAPAPAGPSAAASAPAGPRPPRPRPPRPRPPRPAPAAPGAVPVRRGRSRRGLRPLTLLFIVLAAVAGYAAVVATRGDGTRRVSASLTEDEVRTAARTSPTPTAPRMPRRCARRSRATSSASPRTARRRAARPCSPSTAASSPASDVDAYELDDLQVVRGAAGRAAGSYTVKRSGHDDIKGRVAFGVVREAGRPRIAMIATQPE